MKKIIYICIFTIFLIVSVVWYFSPISLNNIVSKQTEVSLLEEIDINVFLSTHLQKSYKISEKANTDNLIKVFESIKVRRMVASPEKFVFKPSFNNTYYLQLISNNKTVNVDFMDKDYIIVKNRIYKIVNEPNLKQIYDIIDSTK